MTKKIIETRLWDVVDHLQTDEDMIAYLDAALEDGDPGLIVAALGDIARAKGMTQVAAGAGLGRESLYKALTPGAKPRYDTMLKLLHALGVKLSATPVHP